MQATFVSLIPITVVLLIIAALLVWLVVLGRLYSFRTRKDYVLSSHQWYLTYEVTQFMRATINSKNALEKYLLGVHGAMLVDFGNGLRKALVRWNEICGVQDVPSETLTRLLLVSAKNRARFYEIGVLNNFVDCLPGEAIERKFGEFVQTGEKQRYVIAPTVEFGFTLSIEDLTGLRLVARTKDFSALYPTDCSALYHGLSEQILASILNGQSLTYGVADGISWRFAGTAADWLLMVKNWLPNPVRQSAVRAILEAQHGASARSGSVSED